MVVGSADEMTREQIDSVFHALADATRRDILERSLQSAYSVSALARVYPMSFAAVQKHVTVLENAGLVRKTKSGREQLVEGDVAEIARVRTLLDKLEALWRTRLDVFSSVLTDTQAKKKERSR